MKPRKLPLAAALLSLALAPLQADLVLPTVPAEVPGAPPPTAQRMADEWVLLRVVQVQRDGPQVRAVGVVLREFVSQSDLKTGDVIYIDYSYRPPAPDQVSNSRTPYVGFGTTPPLLTGGEVTYGFLRQVGEWRYTPAAGAWSFAPPVGLWPEVVASLQMDFTEGAQARRTASAASVAPPAATDTAAQPVSSEANNALPEVDNAQAITVFLEGRAESYVRVTAPVENRTVYEGRLRPSTYVGVTGKPPLLIESTDYTAFSVELPNRQAVQPYPGSDYGMVRVPLETTLIAPSPALDLGPPPPVFAREPATRPTIPGLPPEAAPPPSAGAPGIPGLPREADASPPLRENAPRALTFEALRLRQEAPPAMTTVASEAEAAAPPEPDPASVEEAPPLRETSPRALTFEALQQRRQSETTTPVPAARALTFEALRQRQEATPEPTTEAVAEQPTDEPESEAAAEQASADPTQGPRAKRPAAE
ncbi:MAG: hypothetical protein ACFB20_02745 [Opitutales bacterium]